MGNGRGGAGGVLVAGDVVGIGRKDGGRERGREGSSTGASYLPLRRERMRRERKAEGGEGGSQAGLAALTLCMI